MYSSGVMEVFPVEQPISPESRSERSQPRKTPRKSIRKQLRAAIDELAQIAERLVALIERFGLRIDAATDKVCDAKDQL